MFVYCVRLVLPGGEQQLIQGPREEVFDLIEVATYVIKGYMCDFLEKNVFDFVIVIVATLILDLIVDVVVSVYFVVMVYLIVVVRKRLGNKTYGGTQERPKAQHRLRDRNGEVSDFPR